MHSTTTITFSKSTKKGYQPINNNDLDDNKSQVSYEEINIVLWMYGQSYLVAALIRL